LAGGGIIGGAGTNLLASWARCRRARRRAHQDHQQFERTRHLPSAQVSRRRVAPDVGRKSRPGASNLARDFDDDLGRRARLTFGELRRVFGIDLAENIQEGLEGLRALRMLFAQKLLQLSHRRRNSRSYRRSRRITWHIASSTAASVPGQVESHQSALVAVLESRVSITQTLARAPWPR